MTIEVSDDRKNEKWSKTNSQKKRIRYEKELSRKKQTSVSESEKVQKSVTVKYKRRTAIATMLDIERNSYYSLTLYRSLAC